MSERMNKERAKTKRERKIRYFKWKLYYKPKLYFKKLHRKIFKGAYCKNCGGRLRKNGMYGLGAHADHIIWKCEKCGEEWI